MTRSTINPTPLIRPLANRLNLRESAVSNIFAGMVLDSYAEVHALLTERPEGAMFLFSMLRRTLLFMLLLTASHLAVLRQSAGREQEPWFGQWNLNLAKSSDRSDSPRYKRATCRIEPWEDGLKVTYDMVGTRGGVTHMEWTGRFDGKDYPVQGVDYVLTNAYRKIDDRTYEIVIKIDGTLAATSRVVVSPDGKTLNVATEEKGASGQTVHATAIYEKQ